MRGFSTASGETAIRRRSRIYAWPAWVVMGAWVAVTVACLALEARRTQRVALVVLLAGALYVLHPAPKVAWFDTPLVAHEFNARGWVGGMAWYRDYHNFHRPVRALEWNLMAHAFGENPRAYHAVNALSVAACAGLLTSLLGGVAAAAWLASYVTIYPLLHFPLAANFALGLSGFSLILSGHGPVKDQVSPRLPVVLGVLLVCLAALGHEVFLVFAVLPAFYSRWVRALPQGGVWGSLLALPLWWLTRGTSDVTSWPSFDLEHVARVGFSILSLGAAPEILREVGWPEPYARVRDILRTWQGWGIAHMMMSSVMLMLILACVHRRWNGRFKFRVAWAALASLPLLLPVGTPESYHLIGAVAPMAAICESGWRRAKWLLVLVPLIALPHLAARWQLFYRDLPVMSGYVKEERKWPGSHDWLLIQVGGHYAFFPRIPESICGKRVTWTWNAVHVPDLDVWWSSGQHLTSHPTGGSIPLCK